MLHPSFEPDTLFLVFEEDWRLEDDKPSEDVSLVAAASHGFFVRGTHPVGASHYIPTAGMDAKLPEQPSTAADLVALANKASKVGHGDIVWMTWQPGQGEVKKGITKIKSGAMLLSFTVAGARLVSEAISRQQIACTHFDLQLLKFVIEHGSGKFSYIFPPVGNYSMHVSGCEKMYAEEARPTCWSARWCCPGTRRSQDPQKRDKYVCFPKKSGNPDWLSLVDLEKEFDSLCWTSFWDVPGVARPDCRKKQAASEAASSSSQSRSSGWKRSQPEEVARSVVEFVAAGFGEKFVLLTVNSFAPHCRTRPELGN
jgi:hypothetical protein